MKQGRSFDDKAELAQQRLEEFLLEGIESGEATPFTDRDWTELRAEAMRQFLEKRRARDSQ